MLFDQLPAETIHMRERTDFLLPCAVETPLDKSAFIGGESGEVPVLRFGEDAHQREKAEREREDMMRLVFGKTKVLQREIENVRQRLFIMQKTEQQFHRLCHEEEIGERERGTAGRERVRSRDKPSFVVFLDLHGEVLEAQEGTSHAALQASCSGRTRRKTTAFAREQNQKTVRLPDIVGLQDNGLARTTVGHGFILPWDRLSATLN